MGVGLFLGCPDWGFAYYRRLWGIYRLRMVDVEPSWRNETGVTAYRQHRLAADRWNYSTPPKVPQPRKGQSPLY